MHGGSPPDGGWRGRHAVCGRFLEGGFRQLVQSTPLRFAIGFGVGALWVAYFTLAGREQRR